MVRGVPLRSVLVYSKAKSQPRSANRGGGPSNVLYCITCNVFEAISCFDDRFGFPILNKGDSAIWA